MDESSEKIPCRICGRLLMHDELASPFTLCAECRVELKLKPRSIQEFTAYLLLELSEHPTYQAAPAEVQDAARRNIIQAGLDLEIESSEKYWRAQRLRHARASTGRLPGRPANLTVMAEHEFRQALASHLTTFPHDNKTRTAAALGLDLDTLNGYLKRWNIEPPSHWRGHPKRQTPK